LLVELFTPYEQTESILGDLLEEFADRTSKSEAPSARRWYWRQSVRTILHLVGSGFRVAPWSVVGAIISGFLLLGLASGLPERVTLAVLDSRQPHVTPYLTWPQVQARLFWLTYGTLTALLLMSMLTGCIVAVLAKGREMAAAGTLSLLVGVLGAVEFLVWSAINEYTFLPLPLVNAFGVPIMIAIGGALVRTIRLAATRRATQR
jgi:hypothetical protein